MVYGIAARDINRALSYAKKFKIPNVFETYEDLINDPNIDAIYNPLPNGLHAYWTIKALNAGKAVLCEKPIASNAYEAKEMLKAAEKNNALLVEAVHSRFHPVAKHVYNLIHTSKVIGNIQHVSTNFNNLRNPSKNSNHVPSSMAKRQKSAKHLQKAAKSKLK